MIAIEFILKAIKYGKRGIAPRVIANLTHLLLLHIRNLNDPQIYVCHNKPIVAGEVQPPIHRVTFY
jgi:hypothetical protein